MKIIKLEPQKPAEVIEIEHSLEAMQKIVGGYIDLIYPFNDSVAMIMNDDGKLQSLPLNRVLRHQDTGQIYDVVCGTCFLIGAPNDSDEFTDLTDEQIEKYMKFYRLPEYFMSDKGKIIVLQQGSSPRDSIFLRKNGRSYIIKHHVDEDFGFDVWAVEQLISKGNHCAEVFTAETIDECIKWVEKK